MNEAWIAPEYDEQLEKLEIELLLEGLFRAYGYDFRHYAFPSLRRRIWHRIGLERLNTVSALQERVLHDREAFDRLLSDLVIPVTELFRDPGLFAYIREKLAPALGRLPFARIWHAGCASGEEAYSMAILLEEEGILSKSRIYATDINHAALKTARDRLVPCDRYEQYRKNYERSGGKADFALYVDGDPEDGFTLKRRLNERIVFAEHNLVTDRSFNEFHAIFCRNVMIYFNPELRNRVHRLLYESLADGGFLILGGKESISFTKYEDKYETWNDEFRVYRKIG
ncbi:CheR family methyltransferase [Cohnella algarum]|uniref:CheR family methyltransferase n=1 Tax=Cohnella algarum TaxID=2044859 RepID=UPI00196861A2|nr:CheR family methyltransferase [Cohnella algarum]MBN2979787.1 protein-glutamate O-methyltransferase CheR [Cohnella algarum]